MHCPICGMKLSNREGILITYGNTIFGEPCLVVWHTYPRDVPGSIVNQDEYRKALKKQPSLRPRDEMTTRCGSAGFKEVNLSIGDGPFNLGDS